MLHHRRTDLRQASRAGSKDASSFVKSFIGMMLLAILFAFAGCGHLGARVQRSLLPPGAPQESAILADLAANDRGLHTFRGAGTFQIESPELEATQRFDGSIFFRRPSDLHVVGRNLIGIKIFDLTCVGKEYLVQTSKDRYYSLGGEQIPGVSWQVSPSDVVREMFLPEAWPELDAHRVQLAEYDPEHTRATLLLGPKRHPYRKVVVEGPPWDVVYHERYGDRGEVLATTTLGEYHVLEGVRFPAFIEASFPSENTRMTFQMRKIQINTSLDNSLFTIERPDAHDAPSH